MSRHYMTGAERFVWIGVRHYLREIAVTGLAFGVGRLTARRRARTI